ncbi:MAG TPA: hypothetical protein ENF57_03070 [Candidatus Korarchaeota archaeon]|nr:hypothetical protein [Candidatus Korarchaeota archaeon]
MVKVGQHPGTYRFVVAAAGGGITKTAEATITVAGSRCVIATVTYGGELSDEVQLLREFRDNVVMESSLGRSFMKAFNAFYYSWSPQVAEKIDENPLLKTYMKYALYPLIYTLRACQWFFQPLINLNIEVGVLVMGLAASVILGVIYLGPALYLAGLIGVRVDPRTVKYVVLCLICSFGSVIASYFTASAPAMMVSTSMVVLSSIALGGIMAVVMVRFASRRLSHRRERPIGSALIPRSSGAVNMIFVM